MHLMPPSSASPRRVLALTVFAASAAALADPPRAPAQGGYASVRTMSLDAETVRVTLAGAIVSSGAPSSPPPASTSPSAGPTTELTPAMAHDIMQRHLPELAACAAAGATNGRVHGSITLRLVIDPTGAIRDASAPQSTMNWSVPRCATDAARTWRFPHPPSGFTIVIVWPLRFTSE